MSYRVLVTAASALLLAASAFGGDAFVDFSNVNAGLDEASRDTTVVRSNQMTWHGGRVAESANPALRSAGFAGLEVTSGSASVVFDRPVSGVRFFYVHGQGIPAGTATALSADGNVLGTFKSREATTFGDSRNFVRFESKQPIAALEFSGGSIDSFQTTAFNADFDLVQGSWVNDDVPENNAAGIFFDHLSTEQTLFAAWFTYTSEPKIAETLWDGDVGSPDNRWLVAEFATDTGSNELSGTLFAAFGGEFNRARTDFQITEAVGSISVDFIDCDRAIVSYDLDEPVLSGTFEIIPTEKQINPDGFSCIPDPSAGLQGQFAGSEACATCHIRYYEGWAGSTHPKMIKPASEGMWDISRQFIEEELAKEDSPFLEIGGGRGRVESIDDIAYTSGHKWKQRFVVQTDEGFAFMGMQVNPAHADQPDRITPYVTGNIYEDRCLGCHVTGLDLDVLATLDRTADHYDLDSAAVELGIGCESCHGPAAAHIADPFNKNKITNPANMSARAQMEFCATCHGRNAGHVELAGRQDPIGYQFGMDVREVTKVLSLVTNEYVSKGLDEDGNVTGYFDPGGSLRFWADATARSHRMHYNEFEMNTLKMQLGFTCTTCHDSHDPSHLVGGSWENLLETDLGNQSCSNCHLSKIARGWDIDEAMPYNAQSASGVRDIRRHTLGPHTMSISPDIPVKSD